MILFDNSDMARVPFNPFKTYFADLLNDSTKKEGE